jgi:hypothetical protein
MSVQLDEDYDRERLALYLAGLLPNDLTEAKAVLTLAARLLPVLHESRIDREADQRDDD